MTYGPGYHENDLPEMNYKYAFASACDDEMDESKLLELQKRFYEQLKSVDLARTMLVGFQQHLQKWSSALNPEKESQQMLRLLETIAIGVKFDSIIARLMLVVNQLRCFFFPSPSKFVTIVFFDRRKKWDDQ